VTAQNKNRQIAINAKVLPNIHSVGMKNAQLINSPTLVTYCLLTLYDFANILTYK